MRQYLAIKNTHHGKASWIYLVKNAAATGALPDPYKLVLPKGLIAPYASNEAIKTLGST